MGSQTVGHNWAISLSLFTFHALEKEMATHSSILAWRIPGTGEPDGLPSVGFHRVRQDWSDLAAAATYLIHRLLLIIYSTYFFVWKGKGRSGSWSISYFIAVIFFWFPDYYHWHSCFSVMEMILLFISVNICENQCYSKFYNNWSLYKLWRGVL